MMSEPIDRSASAAPRKGSLLRTLAAVAWSFFGVRKSRDLERDVAELKPVHVVLVGIAVAALFVVALVLICALELRQYMTLFVDFPLYELVPEGLLRALHILK